MAKSILITILLLGVIGGKNCFSQFAFIVVSDPHFTGDSLCYEINRKMVEDMNSLSRIDGPGKYKKSKPGFVWMLGDMTDSGQENQFLQYDALYGLNGENVLKYPVMECFGNHDGNSDGIVRSQIRIRNTQRKLKTHVSSNGLHYSWDKRGIHFVNLNLYPANAWDPDCEWCKYFKESFREAENSLEFLEQDLRDRVGDSGKPVILAFHLGFDDFGLKWWTERDREKFYNVIQQYNVIAIFQGHNHSVGKFNWNNIDVWAAGSPRHDAATGEYLVVQVSKTGELSVYERKYGSWK